MATPTSPAPAPPAPRSRLGGLLGLIERLGNALPDPIFLFIGATALVIAISAAADFSGWTVQPQQPQVVMDTATDAAGNTTHSPRQGPGGRPVLELVPRGAPIGARSLATVEGVYWLVANMIRNFLNFPPLGVVLVSMFGIGVAEKVGLFGTCMKWLAAQVPSRLLTPTVVLLGILSNVASDAGYIILPPLAAALYAACGRSPMAGIAAAFAGVSAGFSANVMVAAGDALVAGITEAGARVIEPSYVVLATCNWWFMAASTVLLVLVGWAVTAWIVEPRLTAQRIGMDGLDAAALAQGNVLSTQEVRGLRWALLGLIAAGAFVAGLLFIPGAPLQGDMPAAAPRFGEIPAHPTSPPGAFTPTGAIASGRDATPGSLALKPGFTVEAQSAADSGQAMRGTFRTTQPIGAQGRLEPGPAAQPRWSVAIVPIILFVFLIPGLAYGMATGSIAAQKDVTKCFIHAMSSMAPVIAMAFFAAQFLECLRYSRLDTMIANVGGQALVTADLPPRVLLIAVVILTMIVNILMSSMSAKWTALSPIVVPMMMMVGISPELTQMAYRVGDSVTNIVTPLNTYIIVILVAVQRWVPKAGIGNLIAMMLPYSVVFFIVWSLFIVLWVTLGIEPGPGAPLWYVPAGR